MVSWVLLQGIVTVLRNFWLAWLVPVINQALYGEYGMKEMKESLMEKRDPGISCCRVFFLKWGRRLCSCALRSLWILQLLEFYATTKLYSFVKHHWEPIQRLGIFWSRFIAIVPLAFFEAWTIRAGGNLVLWYLTPSQRLSILSVLQWILMILSVL